MTSKPEARPSDSVVNLASNGRIDFADHVRSGRLTWKFVVIKTAHQTVLVIGPVKLYRYHSNLVDGFCRMQDIPAAWAGKANRVEVYDRSVKVLGGGHFNVEPESRRIRFYGQSTTYGPFDAKTVSTILGQGGFFAGYSILID